MKVSIEDFVDETAIIKDAYGEYAVFEDLKIVKEVYYGNIDKAKYISTIW